MLSGEHAVLQAPMFDGLSFDPFTLFDDGRRPAEVGVGRCHIGQALVVALVVVVLDEGFDLGLEVAMEHGSTGQPGTQRLPSIEITPAMIEASAMVLIDLDTDQVSWQDRARSAVAAALCANEEVAVRKAQLG